MLDDGCWWGMRIRPAIHRVYFIRASFVSLSVQQTLISRRGAHNSRLQTGLYFPLRGYILASTQITNCSNSQKVGLENDNDVHTFHYRESHLYCFYIVALHEHTNLRIKNCETKQKKITRYYHTQHTSIEKRTVPG